MSATVDGQGKRLLSLIEALDCAFGLERSVKLSASGINTDRFLASLHKDSLGDDPHAGLSRLARAMLLPEPFLDMLLGQLGEADIVHVGHEGGEAGAYKLYLEFAERVRNVREQQQTARAEPELVHLSVKWRPGDPQSAAVSRYFWPSAAREIPAIKARLAKLVGSAVGLPSVEAAMELIDAARRRCDDDEIFFMEVDEEGSARRSFDVNVYAADLTVSAIDAPILKLANSYLLDREAAKELLSRIGPLTLGHLSGGVGRNGKDFATVYFGVESRKGTGRG